MRIVRDGETIVVTARSVRATPIWYVLIGLLAICGFLGFLSPIGPTISIVLVGTFALSASMVRASESAARPWIGGPRRSLRINAARGVITRLELDGVELEPIDPWSLELRHMIVHVKQSRVDHYIVFLKLSNRVIELKRSSTPDGAATFLRALSRAIGAKVPPLEPRPLAALHFPCLLTIAMVFSVLLGVALAMGAAMLALMWLEQEPGRWWVGLPAALALVLYDQFLHLVLRRSVSTSARAYVAQEHLGDAGSKVR